MPFKSNEPYLQWGGKIDPLSEIRNAGIITTGNVVWVKHPNDTDYRTVKEAVGRENLFDTPQAAIDSPKVRNGKNDYVLICPRDNSTSWVPAGGTVADIQLNKDQVHLIGLGYTKALDITNSTVIQLSGTAGTIGSMGALYVTGDGCEVAGLVFLGTAGTASVGTLGQGNDGGMVTVGAGVNGFDLHDFRIEKQGIQWDAGTTGITGTPRGDINIGSAAKNITIRDGYDLIGTGLKASASHGVNLGFNNTNIRVTNVEFVANKDAAASRFINAAAGTANNAMQLFAERCKFINTNGTVCASAFAGTMGVGMYAIMNECFAVRCTETGTPGSCFIAPLIGIGTIQTGIKNPYLAVGTTPLVISAP